MDNLETRATLDTRHGTETNKRRRRTKCDIDYIIVVKELRSKMFGQHPGYFKAVFLKQTRIINVSIYKYTVYIMF